MQPAEVPTDLAPEHAEIVSPEAATPPQVGTTPQEGPMDVVMPESLSPAVPTVGSDVNPIEAIVPPLGFEPNEDTTIDPYGIVATCKSGYSMYQGQCLTPGEIDAAKRKDEQEQGNEVGDFDNDPEKQAIAKAFNGTGLAGDDLNKAIDDMYKVINNGLNPLQKKDLLEQTAKLAADGLLKAEDINTYLHYLDKVVVPNSAQVYADAGAIIVQTWQTALPAAATCALADTPLPGPGDVCGVGILSVAAGVTVAVGVGWAASAVYHAWQQQVMKSGSGDESELPPTNAGDLAGETAATPNPDCPPGSGIPCTGNESSSYYRPTGPLQSRRVGHTFSKHGSHNTNELYYEAINNKSGIPQGQWLDDIAAEEFIASKLPELSNGARIFEVPSGLGRVFMPDGSIRSATHAVLVPSRTGVSTAYPIYIP